MNNQFQFDSLGKITNLIRFRSRFSYRRQTSLNTPEFLYSILLCRLHESYNINGAALTCISGFVSRKWQCVVHSGS